MMKLGTSTQGVLKVVIIILIRPWNRPRGDSITDERSSERREEVIVQQLIIPEEYIINEEQSSVVKAGPPRHFVARGNDPHRSIFGLLNSPD